MNSEKCHFFVSGHKHELMFEKVSEAINLEEHIGKFVGLLTDS